MTQALGTQWKEDWKFGLFKQVAGEAHSLNEKRIERWVYMDGHYTQWGLELNEKRIES